MTTDLSTLEVTRTHPASRLVYRGDGPALVARPLRLTDAEPIARAIAGSLRELRRFMAWAHADQGALAQLERIKIVESEYRSGAAFGMALFDEATGGLRNVFGLYPRTALNPSALEIGYWTPTDHAGRGYATLATRLAIAYAFEWLGADRVQITHDDANAASRRVVEKCGFRFEGKLRNGAARSAPELVAGGYEHTGLTCLYGLVPEDRPSLAWYAPLLGALEAHNLVGYPAPRPALSRRSAP